ncbi:hypothetical protein ACVBEQ_12315 [Nakamurella sp. GG22]
MNAEVDQDRRAVAATLGKDEQVAQTDDALREATDELYSADPDAFMTRRGELAAAAKKSGDTATAKRIAALRKPTRSAYAVNSLARSDPDGMAELVELGERLREAERTVDPRQIRELTKQRRRLVNDLTRRAFDAIGDTSPSSAVRDEVVSTLTAALAEESIAAQVADGTLVKPARWEGFGSVGSPDLTLVPSGTDSGASRRKSEPRLEPTAVQRPSSSGRSREDRAEARRKAEEQEAERKAQQKAAAEEAQRARLADARQAADDAEEAYLLAADEEQTRVDRLRELEEQVADARKAVDEARVQLRRAEIRQRRAGDALARLGG